LNSAVACTISAGRAAALFAAVILSAALAGCGGGGGGLLSGLTDRDSGPQASPGGSIAIAPIVGAPPQIANELSSKVASAAQARSVTVAPQGQGDYNLRGYLAAANDPRGVKITYIWDVVDKAGQRAHRITGEEFVPKSGADTWSGVPGPAAARIAERTAGDLSAWLSGDAAARPQPVATAPQPRPQPQAQAPAAQPQQPQAVPQQPQVAAAPADAQTFIAPVSGAPGDGSGALQEAMRRKLLSRGVKLAASPNQGAYTVRGVVSLKEGEGGKESIRIDWQVIDPSGRRLGTVSQQNSIPKGSLNGAWGGMADGAAGAATDGVVKLLPRQSG
jgi:hypothetical protein